MHLSRARPEDAKTKVSRYFIDFGKLPVAIVVPGAVVLLLARLLSIAADSAHEVEGAAISIKTRYEEPERQISIFVADSGSGLPDEAKLDELEAYMDALRKEGNSIGARINVVASGVPPGLGEPIFDRLDADLAHGLMSINAVKGVEIGAGFDCVEQKGTEHRDEITP